MRSILQIIQKFAKENLLKCYLIGIRDVLAHANG
jgi:hypothetical protein